SQLNVRTIRTHLPITNIPALPWRKCRLTAGRSWKVTTRNPVHLSSILSLSPRTPPSVTTPTTSTLGETLQHPARLQAHQRVAAIPVHVPVTSLRPVQRGRIAHVTGTRLHRKTKANGVRLKVPATYTTGHRLIVSMLTPVKIIFR